MRFFESVSINLVLLVVWSDKIRLMEYNPLSYASSEKNIYLLTYLITHSLTHSKEQSTSWEANRFSASQEISLNLWNLNVHFRIHKCSTPVPTVSQLDQFHTPTSHFLKIHLNITLPSTPGSPKWSLSFRLPHQNPAHAWVPVTTTLRFLWLRMEERPPIWRVPANLLNKQSRTAVYSSILGVGRDANKSAPYRNSQRTSLDKKKKKSFVVKHKLYSSSDA